jgi:hypothetical protein
MPTVEIYGPTRKGMNSEIIRVIEDIPELDLEGKKLVKLIYPKYRSNDDTVVVKITILENPVRTLVVRNKLARVTAGVIQKEGFNALFFLYPIIRVHVLSNLDRRIQLNAKQDPSQKTWVLFIS